MKVLLKKALIYFNYKMLDITKMLKNMHQKYHVCSLTFIVVQRIDVFKTGHPSYSKQNYVQQ